MSGLMAHPLPGLEPEAWAAEVGGSKKVPAEPARVHRLTRHRGKALLFSHQNKRPGKFFPLPQIQL